eukprot:3369043-Rhodomonas_salina.1
MVPRVPNREHRAQGQAQRGSHGRDAGEQREGSVENRDQTEQHEYHPRSGRYHVREGTRCKPATQPRARSALLS